MDRKTYEKAKKNLESATKMRERADTLLKCVDQIRTGKMTVEVMMKQGGKCFVAFHDDNNESQYVEVSDQLRHLLASTIQSVCLSESVAAEQQFLEIGLS